MERMHLTVIVSSRELDRSSRFLPCMLRSNKRDGEATSVTCTLDSRSNSSPLVCRLPFRFEWSVSLVRFGDFHFPYQPSVHLCLFSLQSLPCFPLSPLNLSSCVARAFLAQLSKTSLQVVVQCFVLVR
jgi:hypothetical protein